ncbi:hypothetical protein B0H11DRAFT_2422521, partial [Mycena galericulata]
RCVDGTPNIDGRIPLPRIKRVTVLPLVASAGPLPTFSSYLWLVHSLCLVSLKMTRIALFGFLTTCTLLSRAAPIEDNRRALNSSALPSATQQGATSTPTLTMVTEWQNYSNGTIGYALNQLLSAIGPDATQRWVTAEIGTTQIGGLDPAGSNLDLSNAVDVVFGGEQGMRWVDKYTEFLLEAGGSDNISATLVQQYNNATKVYAETEVKLVKAYGATHPANVTYVGVNVPGLKQIPPMTLDDIRNWGAAANCTSSADSNSNITVSQNTTGTEGPTNCPFSAEDYKAYLAAASTFHSLEIEYNNLTRSQNMSLQGYQLQSIFNSPTPLGIFNYSMDIGGSGLDTQYVAAWTATVVGLANSSKIIEADLEAGLTDSTVNDTSYAVIKRNGTAEADPSTEGFGALQFIAGSTTPPTTNSKVAHSTSAEVMPAAALGNVDPLDQPLQNRRLVLLALQEGAWADNRDQFIQDAGYNSPDIIDKYFGSGSSGSGPIGRRWTHIVLAMVVDDSSQVSAQLLGKVYEVLPVLSITRT